MKTVYASDLAKSLSTETNRAIATHFENDFYIPAQEFLKKVMPHERIHLEQSFKENGIAMVFADTLVI